MDFQGDRQEKIYQRHHAGNEHSRRQSGRVFSRVSRISDGVKMAAVFFACHSAMSPLNQVSDGKDYESNACPLKFVVPLRQFEGVAGKFFPVDCPNDHIQWDRRQSRHYVTTSSSVKKKILGVEVYRPGRNPISRFLSRLLCQPLRPNPAESCREVRMSVNQGDDR